MSEFRVKMIVNDRSTFVIVSAYNAADAARLTRAQFAATTFASWRQAGFDDEKVALWSLRHYLQNKDGGVLRFTAADLLAVE